jgi:hypothetical protein
VGVVAGRFESGGVRLESANNQGLDDYFLSYGPDRRFHHFTVNAHSERSDVENAFVYEGGARTRNAIAQGRRDGLLGDRATKGEEGAFAY